MLRFRTDQLKTVKKALRNGDIAKARRALKKKPKIHIKSRKKRGR